MTYKQTNENIAADINIRPVRNDEETVTFLKLIYETNVWGLTGALFIKSSHWASSLAAV